MKLRSWKARGIRIDERPFYVVSVVKKHGDMTNLLYTSDMTESLRFVKMMRVFWERNKDWKSKS